jgi:hypothetical protein
MALSARSIITVAQAKLYLKVGASETSLDSLLESWIDIVSGQVEDLIEQNYAITRDVTSYLSGDGGCELFLQYYPFQGLSEATEALKLANLQYRGSVLDTWHDLLTEVDYVFTDPVEYDRIKLLGYTVFPCGEKNIKVTYSAGWGTTATVPSTFTKVALEMLKVMDLESAEGKNSLGYQSKSTAAAGVSGSDSFLDMMPRWNGMLQSYKRLRRPLRMVR